MTTLAGKTATHHRKSRAQKRRFKYVYQCGEEGQSLERLFKRSCNMGGDLPQQPPKNNVPVRPQATHPIQHNSGDLDGGTEHSKESIGKRRKVVCLPCEEDCGKRRNRAFEPCSTVKRMRFIEPIQGTAPCDEKTSESPVLAGRKHAQTFEGPQDHHTSSRTNVFQKKRDDDDGASAGCVLVRNDDKEDLCGASLDAPYSQDDLKKDHTQQRAGYRRMPYVCGLQNVCCSVDPWYASPPMIACC